MITGIEIQRLRGIQQGKLEGFAPLTVLVGPNGCGKSTVLEAVLLGSSPQARLAVVEAVERRQGVERAVRWLGWRLGKDGPARIGVQTDATRGGWRWRSLHINEGELQVEVAKEGAEGTLGGVRFNPDNSLPSRPTDQPHPIGGVGDVRLVELDDPLAPLHQLYADVKDAGRLKDVVAVLQQVVPGLETLSQVGRDQLALYLDFKDGRAIPAAMAGDGVRSLTRLVLDLSISKGGLLLVEEPETHKHPRAIWQAARAIVATVCQGAQVVLSTHSLELIDALVAELGTDEELRRLALFRLALQAGQLSAILVPGGEVADARAVIHEDLR